MLSSLRKDQLIEWMKDMLNHSFVLDARETYQGTMKYFETLIDEHRRAHENNEVRSRLKEYVPSVGRFLTPLPLSQAFALYDSKYSISKRRFISPSFNEIRHILNLAQVMAIGPNLQLITFDGDQTLYSDGGNFEDNEDLAISIISLLCHGVKVAVVTAAGYGLDGSKYARRLRGLLDRFIVEGLTREQVENFFVFGGECNYLLRCTLQPAERKGEQNGDSRMEAVIVPVPKEEWQAPELTGPKPTQWPAEEIKELLDVAEKSMRDTVQDLNLRAKVSLCTLTGDIPLPLSTSTCIRLAHSVIHCVPCLMFCLPRCCARSAPSACTPAARKCPPRCQWATAAKSSSARPSTSWCCAPWRPCAPTSRASSCPTASSTAAPTPGWILGTRASGWRPCRRICTFRKPIACTWATR